MSHYFSDIFVLAVKVSGVSRISDTCVPALEVFLGSWFSWYICSVFVVILYLTTFMILVFWLFNYSVSHNFSHTFVLDLQVSVVSRLSWYLCSGFTSIRSLKNFLIHVIWMWRYQESHDLSDNYVQAMQVSVSEVVSDTCVLAAYVSGVSRLFWFLCCGCARIISHDFFYTCVSAVQVSGV